MTALHRLLFPHAAAPPRPVEMRPGAVYVHEGARGALELARVIDCATDRGGVSHVRFELIYRYRHKTMSAGERTLALAAFTRRFPRPLDGDEARP